VEAFFTSETDGSQGFAVQLDTLLEGYLKGSTGLLAAKEEGLNRSVARITEQVGRIELRLGKREEILRRQFENLESLMADFQSTASGLDQQLQSIANLNASIAKMKR
jgi:flagellar hook-associated protein 2